MIEGSHHTCFETKGIRESIKDFFENGLEELDYFESVLENENIELRSKIGFE